MSPAECKFETLRLEFESLTCRPSGSCISYCCYMFELKKILRQFQRFYVQYIHYCPLLMNMLLQYMCINSLCGRQDDPGGVLCQVFTILVLKELWSASFPATIAVCFRPCTVVNLLHICHAELSCTSCSVFEPLENANHRTVTTFTAIHWEGELLL